MVLWLIVLFLCLIGWFYGWLVMVGWFVGWLIMLMVMIGRSVGSLAGLSRLICQLVD